VKGSIWGAWAWIHGHDQLFRLAPSPCVSQGREAIELIYFHQYRGLLLFHMGFGFVPA